MFTGWVDALRPNVALAEDGLTKGGLETCGHSSFTAVGRAELGCNDIGQRSDAPIVWDVETLCDEAEDGLVGGRALKDATSCFVGPAIWVSSARRTSEQACVGIPSFGNCIVMTDNEACGSVCP